MLVDFFACRRVGVVPPGETETPRGPEISEDQHNYNNLLNNLLVSTETHFYIRFIKALFLPWWLCSVHFCRVRISEIPGQSLGRVRLSETL